MIEPEVQDYYHGYGYVFYNPAPKPKGLRPIKKGGSTVPFGTISLVVMSKWFHIFPKDTLLIRVSDPHYNTIIRSLLTHRGNWAQRDMGLRMFDWKKIMSVSEEEKSAYFEELDAAGREALVDTISLVVEEGRNAENDYRKEHGRQAIGLTFKDKKLLAYRDKIVESLRAEKKLSRDQELEAIAAMDAEDMGAGAAQLNIKMPKKDLLKRAKKLGAKGLSVQMSPEEIIDAARKAEREVQEEIEKEGQTELVQAEEVRADAMERASRPAKDRSPTPEVVLEKSLSGPGKERKPPKVGD